MIWWITIVSMISFAFVKLSPGNCETREPLLEWLLFWQPPQSPFQLQALLPLTSWCCPFQEVHCCWQKQNWVVPWISHVLVPRNLPILFCTHLFLHPTSCLVQVQQQTKNDWKGRSKPATNHLAPNLCIELSWTSSTSPYWDHSFDYQNVVTASLTILLTCALQVVASYTIELFEQFELSSRLVLPIRVTLPAIIRTWHVPVVSNVHSCPEGRWFLIVPVRGSSDTAMQLLATIRSSSGE